MVWQGSWEMGYYFYFLKISCKPHFCSFLLWLYFFFWFAVRMYTCFLSEWQLSLQWDGRASVEKRSLGTHRGLLQARLKIKKTACCPAFKEHFIDWTFNLIVKMYNSSFYRITRDCSLYWLVMPSQVHVAFQFFYPSGTKSREEVDATALLFRRFT